MRERPVWRPTARADEGVGSAIMKLHAMGPFDEGDDPPHSCWIGLNDQAGSDEGLLLLYRPHSRVYGESLQVQQSC